MEAKYPKSVEAGKSASISLTWENRGVAQIFIPAKVTFALLSKDGKATQPTLGGILDNMKTVYNKEWFIEKNVLFYY